MKFRLELDDVPTWAALVYRLKSITQEIDSEYGMHGQIMTPESHRIPTILGNDVGRWAVDFPARESKD